MIVKILLAKEAVAADGQAMVAGEYDERALVLAACLERVQDAADLGVEERDRGIVVGKMLADDLGATRPGSQGLVANGQRTIVEGVLRLKVGRQRRQFGIVAAVKLRMGPRADHEAG